MKGNMITESSEKKGKDVLLIYMPFGELLLPSIGLSLLKSAFLPLGVSAKILYFNLLFAKLISVLSYRKILEQSRRYAQIGEWIFSGALFDQSKRDVKNYIEEILRRPSQSLRVFLTPFPEKLIQTVLKARDKVDSFLNECEQEVLSYRPQIVGFSSVFYQQVASLVLAERIKKHSPDTFIVFGGPNCQGIMGVELVQQFPFVDAVVSGEGDIVFPQLVQRVLEGKSLNDLQGVYTRTGIPSRNNGRYPSAPPLQEMDSMPYLDYGDFFEQLGKSHIHLSDPLSIPLQTSRGCWWGQRIRCTFCAFNSGNRKYASKSSQRVMNELTYLLHKYSATQIVMLDNILDMDYFKNLLPELAVRQPGIDLFCDVKSSLDKEQVRMLRDADFRVIAPGIESLSSRILRLMRKGVSQLQNVQLLKWCKEFGLFPRWNVLWGFPLEPAKEYDRMARLIPLLVHLQPPENFGFISLDRFSPNFEYAEHFGFKDVSPSPAYHHIYPFEPEVVANLAYCFTYQYGPGQNVEEYTRPVVKECMEWRKHFDLSDLFFVDKGKKLFVWDERPIACEPLTILSGLQRVLYITCDSAQSISRLIKIAESYTGKACSKEEIEQELQPIMDKHLIIKDGDSYLSLAIPVGDYVPKRAAFERFQRLLDRMEINKQHETLTKKIKIKEVSKDFRVSKEEIACASGYARSIGNQSICS